MCQRLLLPVFALLLLALLVQRVWQAGGGRERHEHETGMRGGVVVSLGGDRYHVEAVFSENDVLKLYTLGKETDQVLEVALQTLTAHATPEGETQARSVQLDPEPQVGDARGKTSCFAGRLPAGFGNRSLEVRIPNFQIDGARFHLAFVRRHEGVVPAMPQGIEGDEEWELYFVPGGQYLPADIAANGSATAARKFRGFKARHDYNPKPGDLLCPVTRTKADPACTWTIGGRVYAFCCPPCIDEFVRLAKEQPERLLPPESYVK